MQANRIERVLDRAVDTGVSTDRLKRRVALHERSAFDSKKGQHDLSALDPTKKKAQDAVVAEILSKKPRSMDVRLPAGTVLQVPLLSEADHAAIQRVFSRVSPERQAQLDAQARCFAQALFAEAYAFPQGNPSGFSAPLKTQAGLTMEEFMTGSGADDHAEAMEGCMYMGMYGIERELYDFADGLRDKQLVAEDVRTDLGVLKEMLADWPDDGSTQSFTYNEVTVNDDGTFTVTEKTVELNKAEAQGLADKLGLQLESMSTITNMDAFNLERMVNHYQQAMTTLSNIIKQQDEALRGVAQNVKA